jgi:hypothetical protein
LATRPWPARAQPSTDFTPQTGTTTFTSGSATAIIAIPIFGNGVFNNPSLTFSVQLTGVTNVVGPPVTLAAHSDFATGAVPRSVAVGGLNGAAKVIYNVIDDALTYGKDKPGWGEGDSVWACESKTGNCTDFHSLFLSLARSRGIPAKFESGFLLPEKRGSGDAPGYHCWAKFRPEGKGWIPVDISEANKHPDKRE